MLKLLFLWVLPGFLAELIRADIPNIKRFFDRKTIGKRIANSLLFSYILFLLNLLVLLLFFSPQYTDFLFFSQRRIQTVEDLYHTLILFFLEIFTSFALGSLSRIVRYKGIERAFRKVSSFQKQVPAAALVCSLLAAIFIFAAKDNAESHLVINEVCTRNDSIITDENDDYRDYIELYNPSMWNILLKDFRLSDSADALDKMQLDELVVPAKGYCLIWLGDSDYASSSFSLNSGGETLYLSSATGKLLDSVVVPALDADLAYARTNDAADSWTEEVPSPAAANDSLRKYLKEPVFSAESGFYEEEFQLTLQTDEDAAIYYTLDGSIPDSSSTLYTGDITVKNVSQNPDVYRAIPNIVKEWTVSTEESAPVDKAFIIRAIAIDGAGNTSDVVTKTYFVDMEQYQNSYVLSLVSDPDDLFGDAGIYVTGKAYDEWYLGGQIGNPPTVNFELRGKVSEIETTAALFNGTLLMEQSAGLRIQGASRRQDSNKRFSVFARKEYSGSRVFDYELFGQPMHSFFMRPDFEDAFIHSLVPDRSIGTLKYVPADVFLNGEHWYFTYLREKYSEDYLAYTYGVDRENVRYAESVPADFYDYLNELDLSKDEDYAAFCEYIDLASYIDYMATNIYMCNMDASEYKNCRLWKTTTNTGEGYNDGKWRWLLYDTDSLAWHSIGYYGTLRHDIDSFSHSKQYADEAFNQEPIYKALRQNPNFCEQFVLTFMDLANYYFAPDVVLDKLNAWGVDSNWNDGFFIYRYDSIVSYLANEFELQGSLEEITVSVNDPDMGYVEFNTLTPDLSQGSFTGKYYTDYPVTLKATAREGYTFVGWSNGTELIEEEEITVQLTTGGCCYEAIFK